jgi:CRISPR-associated protein Cmr6
MNGRIQTGRENKVISQKTEPHSQNLNYYFNVEYYKCLEQAEYDPENKKNPFQIKDGVFHQQNRAICDEFRCVGANKMKRLPKGEISGRKITAFELETRYPGLLIGTGNPHGTGNQDDAGLGFTFDYVTGMPYLPGSSVKGLLRSVFINEPVYIKDWMKNEKNLEIKPKELEKSIFGERQTEMYLCSPYKRDIFFDAIIIRGNKDNKIMETDNITPHHSSSSEQSGEAELAEPVPVTMLKIRPNVKFCFQFALTDSLAEDDKTVLLSADAKKELFKSILCDFGIGAKTNVGYGILVDPNA